MEEKAEQGSLDDLLEELEASLPSLPAESRDKARVLLDSFESKDGGKIQESLASLEEDVDTRDIQALKRIIKALGKLVGRLDDHHYGSPDKHKEKEEEPSYQARSYKESVHRRANIAEAIRIVESEPGTEGDVWNVEVLKEGMNVSGTRCYAPKSLRSVAKSMENLQCYIDHPVPNDVEARPERSVRELLGWYTGGKVKSGVVQAKLHLLNSGPGKDIVAMIKEAAQRGNPSLVGISIRGTGDVEETNEKGHIYEMVHDIVSLESSDIVTKPGAGGRLLSVAESENQKLREELMKLEEMSVEELLKARPDLMVALEAKKKEDKEYQEYLEYKEKKAKAKKAKESEEDVDEKKKKEEDEEYEEYAKPNKNKKGEKVKCSEEDKKVEESEEIKKLETTRKAVEESLKTLNAQTEEIKRESSKVVVDRELAAVKGQLPDPIIERLRKGFEGKVVDIKAVQEAIAGEKSIYDQILPPETRFEPRAKITKDTAETNIKRLEAMLYNGQKDKDGNEPFHSIHEAYFAFKGWTPTYPMSADAALGMVKEAKGYMSPVTPRTLQESLRHIQESVGQISSWTYALGDTMYRVVLRRYDEDPHEWRWACSQYVESRDLRPVYFSRTGEYTMTPAVAEGGTYQEATFPSEEAITADVSAAKYGILQPVTLEAMIRDDVHVLQQVPLKLGAGFKERQFQTLFNLLASNTAITFGDSAALAHTTHSNKGTTALSAATLILGIKAVRDQLPSGATDRPMGITPKYLLVPNDLDDLGWRLITSDVRIILEASNTPGGAATEPNIFKAKYGLAVQVVDYWSDTDNWWLMVDPKRAGCDTFGVVVYPNEKPRLEVQDDVTAGSVFTADKITWKVSGWFKVVVLDYRTFYGAIV